VKVGSLFSGIGGFDLGLERAGFEIAWQVENNDYCRRVLRKHWPSVPCHYDIRGIDWEWIQKVDVLAGGFPCQDVSHAGKRVGIYGERSSLWFEMLKAICGVRPRWALIENTTGLRDRGLSDVLRSLAVNGYDAEWTTFSACGFGAPHTRERLFIVAYPKGFRPRQLRREQCKEASKRTRHIYWQKNKPTTQRVVDGVPNRLDRCTAIGNAIVPQIAEALGRMILEAEHGMSVDSK
jgi:DNA (cytosine-5)-methyltransferase 1